MKKDQSPSFADNRRYPRAKVSLAVDWGETPACAYEGQLTSLSVGGCFIRTPQRAAVGKAVFIRLLIAPGSESILEGVFQGRLIYRLDQIGLGVEFEKLNAEYRRHIQDIVSLHLEGMEDD